MPTPLDYRRPEAKKKGALADPGFGAAIALAFATGAFGTVSMFAAILCRDRGWTWVVALVGGVLFPFSALASRWVSDFAALGLTFILSAEAAVLGLALANRNRAAIRTVVALHAAASLVALLGGRGADAFVWANPGF